MPQSVNVRAEATMLRISSDLRTIQSQVFTAQDNTAKKIDDAFVSQKWTLYRKPAMEIAFTAMISLVANNPKAAIPSMLIKHLGVNNPNSAKAVEKTTDILTTLTKAVTSIATEPKSTASSAEIERLRAVNAESSNVQQGITSAIASHEQAIQRLEGQVAASRQAG
jgi:hypothetical protein